MSWAAVAGAAVSVVGGVSQSNKAKKGANAQAAAADAAARESGRQYDQTRQDMMPWLNAGTSALAQMQALNSGDFSSFTESPDYQFALTQGLQGLDRSAAARGALYSGGHSADVMNYAGGLASQNYNNYYNRLVGLAGIGQTSANQLGQFGAQNAANQGQYAMGAANARASAYGQQANAWTNALAGVGSAVGYGIGNNWGRK